MKQKETWITLKEAAKISGYSPDYIGELIRRGKIPGKQVVCNIAWMTTKEAILAYKENQKKEKSKKQGKIEKFRQFLKETRQKILLHFEILKLIFKTFRTTFFLLFVFFLIFIFSLFLFGRRQKLEGQKDFSPIEEVSNLSF